MLKFIPLLFKYAPVAWAFIKEVVLKREDKRYFIRNPLQVFITVLIMLYTLIAYILYEGYNAHAEASRHKTEEIQELFKVLDRKIKENTELQLADCPTNLNDNIVQHAIDKNTMDRISLKYHLVHEGEKTQP